jgi:hypothetical protein
VATVGGFLFVSHGCTSLCRLVGATRDPIPDLA